MDLELPAPSFDGNERYGLPEHLARKLPRRDAQTRATELFGQRRELPKTDAPKTGMSLLALRSGR